MNINANRLAAAAILAVAILWTICSSIVMLLPDLSMSATGYMVHSELSGMQWEMNLTGFLVGLVLWSVVAGATTWLLAIFYNKMN